MPEAVPNQVGPEGRIDIDLAWQSGAEGAPTVRIRSSRPTLASQLFEHRPVEQALSLVPLLFSICGRAQSVAAVRAVEAAMATPAAIQVEAQRDALVALETVREHVWRILIDWPVLMGSAPQPAVLAPLNQALAALMNGLDPQRTLTSTPGLQQVSTDTATACTAWQALRDDIEHAVFDSDAGDWLLAGDSDQALPQSGTIAGLDLWGWLQARGWLRLGNVALQALPAMPGEDLEARFNQVGSERWDLRPEWHGKICESGPLARTAGHPCIVAARRHWGYGLGTRLLARLVALAEVLAEIDGYLAGRPAARPGTETGIDTAAQPCQHGVAQVETSRGRLIHCVVLEDGIVWRYRIVAPTEWNFHPAGIATRTLATLSGQQDGAIIEQQARWLLQAIDPCVGFQLKLSQPATVTGGVRRA